MLEMRLAHEETVGEDGWPEPGLPGARTPFDTVYMRHYAAVYRFCCRRVRDPFVAEEIVQEVFLRAFLAQEAHPAGPSLAWLMTVARNLCIDLARTSPPRPVSLDVEPAPVPERLSQRSDPTADDAVVRVSAHRVWRAVHAALDALDPKDRKLLLQRDVEGRSYRELARREGETKDALRNRIWRARAMLHDRLIALREDVRAMGCLPVMAAFMHRRVSRARARLARMWVRTVELSTATASLSGLFVVAMAMATSTHQGLSTVPTESREIIGIPRMDIQSFMAPPITEAHRDQVAEARWKTRVSVSNDTVEADVEVEKKEDALLPESVSSTLDLFAPDRKPKYSGSSGVDCTAPDSETLTATGVGRSAC